MKLKKVLLGLLAFASVLFFAVNVHAARTDMIDISSHNNNGNIISTSQFTSIRNQCGIKAVVVKLSEGSTYQWSGAQQTISNAESAGLYVDGYHYARYSTVDKATEEAQQAVSSAKSAGLSTRAVS